MPALTTNSKMKPRTYSLQPLAGAGVGEDGQSLGSGIREEVHEADRYTNPDPFLFTLPTTHIEITHRLQKFQNRSWDNLSYVSWKANYLLPWGLETHQDVKYKCLLGSCEL